MDGSRKKRNFEIQEAKIKEISTIETKTNTYKWMNGKLKHN